MIATIAPVLASVAIWAVTRSPFALVFALLGPVVALASLADSSWHGRRHHRRALARFEEEVVDTLAEIDHCHRIERRQLDRDHPGIRRLLDQPGPVVFWEAPFDGRLRIGRGTTPSSLGVDGATSRLPAGRVRDAGRAIADRAGRLEDAPVIVDASTGIGLVGAPVVVEAAARALVLRLARTLSPADWSVKAHLDAGTGAHWRFLGALPHARAPQEANSARAGGAASDGTAAAHAPPRATLIEFVSAVPITGAPARFSVGFATRPEDLPRRCRTVIELESAASAFSSSDRAPNARVDPRTRVDVIGADEALAYALALRELARRDGLISNEPELPARLLLSALQNERVPNAPGLACEFGESATEAWSIDLVADGPHAVIGGTTGSGKSELLTSWILAMATRYSPDQVNFLLVDFKGGATFGAISTLPHSVGVITDLDHGHARRALDSLTAEVLHRERELASAGVRSIDELAAAPVGAHLPRLVIVVDEFAALSGHHPELHALFADLAARGRSLGMHLILCTQRPAASLRDAILSNCTLRICLRVNDPADSMAVVGTVRAATLPRAAKGRALVSTAGEAPTEVQVAIAAASDVGQAATVSERPIRRPWREPLPSTLPLADIRPPIDQHGIAFGLVDLPARQRQDTAVWRPESHGNLLALGALGAGKSTLLATLAEAGRATGATVTAVPHDVEGAWDHIVGALADAGSGVPSPPRLLVLDDVDALVDRFGRDHQLEFVEALTRLLRDGLRHGIAVALAARAVTSAIGSIASTCDTRIVLRMPDRSEHVSAGGSGADFDPRLPAGGGFWRGDRLQVGWVPLPTERTTREPPAVLFAPGGATAIVSTAPRTVAASLADQVAAGAVRIVPIAGGVASAELVVSGPAEHVVVLGDLDSWNAAWSMLPTIRAGWRMLFHRCSVADYRSITRTRQLPPALDGNASHVWVLAGDEVERARMPP